MVRENRIKYYKFEGSPTLYGDAATGQVDVYSENPINGRIQSIYFEGGNWDPAGSLTISVSGTAGGLSATEGFILNMTSGPLTGPGAGSSPPRSPSAFRRPRGYPSRCVRTGSS